MQTLTKLYLEQNRIGKKGAQSVAQALLNNKVRECCPLHLFQFHLYLFVQTLKELYLSENQIGYQGAQYLAKALLKNTVKY